MIRFFLFIGFLLSTIGLKAGQNMNSDTVIIRSHRMRLHGKLIKYDSVTGLLPVTDLSGKAIASIFFTYYRRINAPDQQHRPIIFHFGNAYGATSKWVHMGYTAPMIANISEEGFPVQPYGVVENPHSILDLADLIYIDPVGTGYSKVLGLPEDKTINDNRFFSEVADASYLSKSILVFLKTYNRMLSPIFLLGEYANGRRVSNLAATLTSLNHPVNGVILLSSAKIGGDHGVSFDDCLPVFENKPDLYVLLKSNPLWATKLRTAASLVTNAIAARYYGAIAEPYLKMDIEAFEKEVEEFALTTYFSALLKGVDRISDAEREILILKLAAYTSLNTEQLRNINLELSIDPLSMVKSNYMTSRNYSRLGLFDLRYHAKAGPSDRESVDHAYHAAFISYVSEQLGFKTSLDYGSVFGWQNSFVLCSYLMKGLQDAMKKNPFMKVLVQAGYYDRAFNIVSQKMNIWQLNQDGNFTDRIIFKGYEAGQFFYVRKSERVKALNDLREFIVKTIPKPGKQAAYDN